MSSSNLCVSCAQLPRKDRSLAIKKMRCPECKCEFGVTAYGAAFRFSDNGKFRLFSPGVMFSLAAGAGILTMVLVLIGMGMWSSEVVLPPRPGQPAVPVELIRVSEVGVEAPLSHHNPAAAKQAIAQLVIKIKAENAGQNRDAFLLAQMDRRKELRGLPFIMGDQCRMEGDRAQKFESCVQAVRDSMEREFHSSRSQPQDTGAFWNFYQARTGGQGVQTPHGVAALTQMLSPEREPLRHSLVEKLAASPTPDATRALARMAIFDVSGVVRQSSLRHLKSRPKEHNVDDILMHGIRHPMPLVAHRAAHAIAKLERNDLTPQLVAFLDQPAPGDPEKRVVDNKEVCEVREVVRINHHRNCLLCHPPSATGQPNEVPGVIPIPGIPFASSPKDAYGNAQSSGDPMIRADTTYLRQDFSVMMPVSNAAPWPEMQRFDFLVRNRVVEGAELASLLKKVQERPASFLSENHKAAMDALRTLTGRNAAPNPAAWNRVLGGAPAE